MSRTTLNEKPFEHHCRNGTTFTAERCDFVGGVTAYVPAGLTEAQMMADAAELGAWHWANIVPELNGFTGVARCTVIRVGVNGTWRHEALRLRRKPQLLLGTVISLADVGKIFVLAADKSSGRVVTREDFLALPLDQIGAWYEIDEFDINDD